MKSLVFIAALAVPLSAQTVETTYLSQNGWFSDDTRADGAGSEPAGTNLVSEILTDDPEAGASGTSAHDADILAQISFGAAPGAVPAGTHPGAVNLSIAPGSGAGKSQISHRKDDGVGHAPGSAFGPGISLEYSWMGDGTSSVTASVKFGVKTADFGSTGSSSRTGEDAWDKVLIYEPGNLNGGTSDGTWQTEVVDFTTGKWWFFDRTAGGGSIGMPMTLSDMSTSTAVFSGTKTLADVYALITAPGAHITSVQFGIGSGNAGGNIYVNELTTNFYRAGSTTAFGAPDLICDGDVTNEVIFGSGNANGAFTLARANGVEIGLRGKQRFPAAGIYNSNGDGTYTFEAGAATSGASWITPNTPIWNFEWSVNTNYDTSTGNDLDDLTYELSMDFDPGPGIDALEFDPFSTTTVPFWDHAIGDNSTGNGAGSVATDGATFASLIAANNLGQNSWNYEFFNDAPFDTFDPNVPGRYTVSMAAFDGASEVARSTIDIVVVAPVTFDDDVTPDAIFGSGNVNGSYTIERNDGVELGLRGKLRFPPSNVFNSNGDGTYTFDTGAPTSGAGWITANTPLWNHEWSINTNYTGTSGRVLSDLTYEIGIDHDPSADTNYIVFDPLEDNLVFPYTTPVTQVFWDHSIGTNTTGNGAGTEAPDLATYLSLIDTNNVAQNSWNLEFHNDAPFDGLDPTIPGRFEVYLAAFDGDDEVARTAITVITTDSTSLTLEGDPCQTDADCNLPGTQIAVELWGRNLASPATGFQSFLSYDDSELTYEGSASSYGDNVFTLHFQDIATADVVPGELRLDGSVDFLSSDEISDDTLLATLVFTVAEECEASAVSFDLTQAFGSELSYLGSPVATALVDGPAILGDGTPPVLAGSPDITVATDANVGTGCESAVVTYATPAATDNCTGPVTVVCTPPSGTAFPSGETTTVTCLATDACGNTSTSTFDVTVTATNLVDVEVVLTDSVDATRCIHFVVDDCMQTADVELMFAMDTMTMVPPATVLATIEVPCGNWTEICAKDRQHTKWDTSPLTVSGTKYVATSALVLDAGDTDDDGDVDINDVTLFIAQFGAMASPGGCPYDGLTKDADFSNNTVVGAEDYVPLTNNWLTTSMCPCTLPAVGDPPVVNRLQQRLRVGTSAAAARADFDGDGFVDVRDVELFEQRYGLSGELSERMRATQGR